MNCMQSKCLLPCYPLLGPVNIVLNWISQEEHRQIEQLSSPLQPTSSSSLQPSWQRLIEFSDPGPVSAASFPSSCQLLWLPAHPPRQLLQGEGSSYIYVTILSWSLCPCLSSPLWGVAEERHTPAALAHLDLPTCREQVGMRRQQSWVQS